MERHPLLALAALAVGLLLALSAISGNPGHQRTGYTRSDEGPSCSTRDSCDL